MASRRIQGITIEIGGDTTKLQQSLKKVDKELSATRSNLWDINKLLKMDPGNVDLLTQKQKNMEQAIDATKRRLTELQSVERGSMSDQEWDALQREIVETENKLESLEKEYKEFGSVASQQVAAAGDKMKETGDKVTGVGKSLTMGVTAPIIGIGAASVEAFKEVDEGLDTIAIKTGATGKALEEMEDAAKNLATEIPTDFATAGDAVGEVNTRFGLTGKALEDVSGQFIKFAELNQTDVSTSIDTVQASMAAFGLGAKDAGLVLDVLNKAGQDTGVSMDVLSADMMKNASSLKGLGMSYSDAAMFLANLNKNGIDSASVMTGLRKAYSSAAKDGKTLDEALAEMQEQMKGASSDAEASAIAIQMFGNKAGPALADAIREGRISFDELGSSLSDYAGSVSDTFEETLDPIDKMNLAMNEAKLIGTDIVVAAAPMILAALETLRDVLKAVRAGWEAMPEGMQRAIIAFALLAAAIGPVLIVVGKLFTAVGTIMTYAPMIVNGIGLVAGAAKGLWAILLANPIGIVIAVIAALVAAFIYLWNTSESFRQFWINLWETVKQAVLAGVEKIKAILQGIISFVQSNWQSLLMFLVNPFAGAFMLLYNKCDAFRNKVNSMLDAVKNAVTSKFNAIKSFLSGVISWMKNIFNFEWKLPKIKLPHFKISGSFSLNPPSVPSFDVDWYRKAMNGGMILNSPTIFGAAGGKLLGGGEAGPEAVVGVGSLQSMITNAVMAAGATGDIIIPVYVGQERIDEIVVNATNRINYRSGGR